MYRVLTVAREFGSGGGEVAALIAERLNWRLLDNALLLRIAEAARVQPELIRAFDEKTDSWLHRISRRALWHGALDGVAAVAESDFFDAETLAAMATSMIREAHQQGGCVIVGRGAQCVLQSQPDVFHAYIYAPAAHRLARIRSRFPATADAEELMEATDRARQEYTRLYFNADRRDPHLYDLMISSVHGAGHAARVIEAAMHTGGGA